MSERSKKVPNDGLFSPQNLRADRKAVIIVSFSALCLSNVEKKDYWENLLHKRRERREETGEEGKEKEKRKEKESNSLKEITPSTHIEAKTLPAVPEHLLCDYPALLRLVSLQVLAGTTNDSLAVSHDHWNTTTPLGCPPVGGMEVESKLQHG